MKLKLAFFIIISISVVFLTACPSAEQPKPNSTNNSNDVKVNSSGGNVLPNNGGNSQIPVPTPKQVAETTNNAPTLAPILQGYYDALKKKDDAAVKNVMSAGFIKSIEADMKEENKTSIAAFLAETDTIPDKPMEVRNEVIEGDKGVAEVKGGAYPNWTPFAFVKEGGAWKITNESPDIKNVKQSAK